MSDFGIQHIRHAIGHRPHALADLGMAGQAASQPHIHIAILISREPPAVFHRCLGDHRPCFHRCVDFIAGAIQKAGIDEKHPILHRRNARRQIERGAAFLIHDPDFDGVLRKIECLFHKAENRIAEGHLIRAVHLGLHDINRSRTAIAQRSCALQIMKGDGHRHHGIQKALEHLMPLRIKNRRGGHQMPYIAHQQKAAAMQIKAVAIGGMIMAIRRHGPGHCFPALLETGNQIAFHQPQPIIIGGNLVIGIHSGHRILEIHDRGQGGFDDDIGHACGIGLADGMIAIYQYFQMQTMMAQKNGLRARCLAAIAGKKRRLGQRACPAIRQGHLQATILDVIGHRILVRSLIQRRHLIEQGPAISDNPITPDPIIARSCRRTAIIGDCIAAIKSIIKAAPTGIGGIERKARIHHRHHKLRPGNG
ncbi:hypothetical protein AQ1_00467 [alpha proteobacterium Q-1]|nr:hypothetical protein AQ1_00467 [alpha proteobacterium Q-1]